MPGESVPQGLWLPPRVATLLVAANDALDRTRAQADYLCDGVADDVEINAALNALPAGVQGRVVLSEGTFTIVDPITIPASNITLRGQGRSTFIDGDGLATGEHGIVISGKTNVCIKKLSIQTETGGGKLCNCIYISDSANNFEIEYVTIVASDSDGIRIAGTSMVMGRIHDCNIDQADEEGIQVNMDAGNYMYRLNVSDCVITGTGLNGIYAAGRLLYSIIDRNVVYTCGQHGVSILTSSYVSINDNVLFQNTLFGINITSSNHVQANNNICYNNTQHGIYLGNSDKCVLEGNICTLNDRGDTNTYDGIHTNNTSSDNLILGNHCCENHNHGIAVYGTRNKIMGNYCHENDRHGIYIDATVCSVNGNYCYRNSMDGAGTYHGINLTGDASLCQVNDNYCTDPGDRQEDGIHCESGADNLQIAGNYCFQNMGSGIYLEDCDYCLLKANYCTENGDYGIEIGAGAENTVMNNKLIGNITGEILDGGTSTALPYVFIPVPNPSTNIGRHQAEFLQDGLEVVSRFNLPIPAEFQELVRAYVIVVPGATGDLYREVQTDFGKICTAGEVYNEHSDSIAEGAVAVVINELDCISIAAALDGIEARDLVGVEFIRHGDNGSDTAGDCYLLGLWMDYV